MLIFTCISKFKKSILYCDYYFILLQSILYILFGIFISLFSFTIFIYLFSFIFYETRVLNTLTFTEYYRIFFRYYEH